ncbi:MAG: phage Gp37/Gp68 family protein [Flavobacteriales bacterium]|nr:MAG: phage Gp37/Gp68 family protein [Flavobacteriales bacterium]
MSTSTIEWTEVTWNPVTGCTKLSPGCKFCYAEIMSKRLQAMRLPKYSEGFKINIHPDTLNIPFTWKKPRVVFVNSMSDLFHDQVPESFIRAVFNVMNNTPQHTYQVLTKRAERLLEISNNLKWTSNIWMGVSVENQDYAYRADYLARTPASTKFLSIEPLIGKVTNINIKDMDWIIVGGESGHKARPLEYAWITSIKEMADASNVAFFFKQWGKPKFNINPNDPTIDKSHPHHAKGGCELEGKIYRAMPAIL